MAKIVFTKPPANCRNGKEEYGAEFLAQTGSPWFLFPEEVLSSPVLPKAKEFIFLHAALFLVPPHSLCKRIATVPEVPVYGHFSSDDNCGHCRWPAPVNRDCCVCGKDPSLSVVLTFPADKPSVPSVLLPSRCPKRLPGILVMLCWLCPCGAPAAVVTVPQACARSKFLSVYRTLARSPLGLKLPVNKFIFHNWHSCVHDFIHICLPNAHEWEIKMFDHRKKQRISMNSCSMKTA